MVKAKATAKVPTQKKTVKPLGIQGFFKRAEDNPPTKAKSTSSAKSNSK